MLQGRLVEETADLDPYLEAWDALAVAAGRPYCAPGWMLAWWRAAAPAGARLRVAVAVDEAGELIGVAPFWGERRMGVEWLRLLAAPVSQPTSPLAQAGRERECASALAGALAGAAPAPGVLGFDGVPAGCPWPRLLADGWPGGGSARLHTDQSLTAPTVSLGLGDLDEWLAGKSSNFRSQVRRMRRKLEGRGAAFQRIGPDGDVDAALRELARLHHSRWDARGGSAALDEQVERMLTLAAAELAPSGRLWISAIVAEGRTVSAHLIVTAGDEMAYWLGGHDDAWAAQKPGLQALVAAVGDGLEGGARRLDLGPGAQDYKLRLADGAQTLEFLTLLPPGPGRLRNRTALAVHEARRELAQRLTEEQRARLRGILRRGPRQGPAS